MRPTAPDQILARMHRAVYDAVAGEYEAAASARIDAASYRIQRLAGLMQGIGRVLDVGCGIGLNLLAFYNAGFDATGVDISAQMVSFARRRVPNATICTGDVRKMRFSAPFDVITADAFLHLFPMADAASLLKMLVGLVCPNGIVSASTTISTSPAEGFMPKADYKAGPVRFRSRWTEPGFLSIFENAGLTVVDSYRVTGEHGKVWLVVSGSKR